MHALLMMLRRKATDIDSTAIVVQRHKRAPSIINKLRRFPQMELNRMQDIGGCRAIVSTVSDAEQVSQHIQQSSTRHKLHRVYDYIDSPKDTGYRGIHLTYKYNGSKSEYTDYFVEIQVRSKIQHAWATAVEIVDTFTSQALKSNQGTTDWLDFFRVASAEFAKLEERPVGTSVNPNTTFSELTRLAEKLSVFARLNAFAVTTNLVHEKFVGTTDYFLLELTEDAAQVLITPYKTSDFDRATAAYLEKEKRANSGYASDVVLVAASSLQALHNAYPNYFADSKEFLRYLRQVLY